MRALAAVALVAVAAGPAGAAGFALAEQGALAGGTAGAGTARAGDPAAGWYNPAALADGAGVRLGVGALLALPTVTATAADGSWSTDSESRVATPPHLYVSLARGAHAWGIAAGVPFGSGVSWPAGWQGRHEIISSRLEVARVAGFYAWRRGAWRVAGGAHVDFGRLRISRSLDFIDTDGTVALDMNGVGFGLDGAVWWQAARGLALGLSVKTRSTLTLSGGADFEAPLAVSAKAQDQEVSSRLVLPDRVALGARWERGRLALLGDLELTAWSVHQRTVIDFAREQTPDVVQDNRWSTTLAVRAGAEVAMAPAWAARGGLFLDPSPAQADTLAPSSPDSTRAGLTLGLGRRLGKRVSLDAFYEYLHIFARGADNEEALAASYRGHAHLLGVGLRVGAP